jgi:protein ImuB
MVLAATNKAAAALGLVPGRALADARARVPDLVVLDHAPTADAVLLDWLVMACEVYSPAVAPAPPYGLVIDIAGCTHFFGHDETRLRDDLAARLARFGLTAQLALADTPEAALALARHGEADDDVRLLPVEALAIGGEDHLALRRAGLRTIGDLADRPRTALAARFGEGMTDRLARLLGEIDGRITPHRSLPAVHEEARFAEPLNHVDSAFGVIGELAELACTTLRERALGARRLTASLFRSDGHVARIMIETATPSRDPVLLMRLFREKLGSLNDPLDPGFGYDMIRLAVDHAEPLASTQLDLNGGSATDQPLATLVGRLANRFGRDRITRFASGDSYIPEQAAFELSAIDPPLPQRWSEPEPGEPPLRPLHLFDPPQRVDVIAAVPDGPPLRFRWRRRLHHVLRYEGPERIAPEWWQRQHGHEPGRHGLSRDYYRIEDAHGRRFWLFRHGLYGSEKVDPDWYMHGIFA